MRINKFSQVPNETRTSLSTRRTDQQSDDHCKTDERHSISKAFYQSASSQTTGNVGLLDLRGVHMPSSTERDPACCIDLRRHFNFIRTYLKIQASLIPACGPAHTLYWMLRCFMWFINVVGKLNFTLEAH